MREIRVKEWNKTREGREVKQTKAESKGWQSEARE